MPHLTPNLIFWTDLKIVSRGETTLTLPIRAKKKYLSNSQIERRRASNLPRLRRVKHCLINIIARYLDSDFGVKDIFCKKVLAIFFKSLIAKLLAVN
jgi:hypothetical protein